MRVPALRRIGVVCVRHSRTATVQRSGGRADVLEGAGGRRDKVAAMSLSRREFLGRAAAAAFASAGAYGLIDQIAKPVRRESISPDIRLTVATTPSLPLEQHLYSGLSRVTDNGAIIVVPPLHHMVVTATLTVPPAGFTQAQEVLETAIAGLETSGLLDFTPSGMGLAVACPTSIACRRLWRTASCRSTSWPAGRTATRPWRSSTPSVSRVIRRERSSKATTSRS